MNGKKKKVGKATPAGPASKSKRASKEKLEFNVERDSEGRITKVMDQDGKEWGAEVDSEGKVDSLRRVRLVTIRHLKP